MSSRFSRKGFQNWERFALFKDSYDHIAFIWTTQDNVFHIQFLNLTTSAKSPLLGKITYSEDLRTGMRVSFGSTLFGIYYSLQEGLFYILTFIDCA